MIWLLIWIASIIANIVTVLLFAKKENGKITYFGLFWFFIAGVIIAPLLTIFILIGGIIKFYNRFSNMDIMNKTIYKFK
jgi:hypothetical protein